ncbi:MAG: hypothetical protein ACRD0P_39350, partial [Stackebrandtia sp.]
SEATNIGPSTLDQLDADVTRIANDYVHTPPMPMMVEMLQRIDIDIPGVGSAVMLPTGMGRWNREGCNWVVPPERDGVLPPLSSVINAALLAGGNRE